MRHLKPDSFLMKKLNKVMDLSFNIIFVSPFFCWSSHLLLKLNCILKSKNYHDNLLYGISTKYSLSGKFSFCSNFHVHLKYCHILYVIENFLDHKKITCVNYKDACTVNWVLICVCVYFRASRTANSPSSTYWPWWS